MANNSRNKIHKLCQQEEDKLVLKHSTAYEKKHQTKS